MERLNLNLEYPTLCLIIASYCAWLWLVISGDFLFSSLWILLFALVTTLFLSLTHEVIHGHPTRSPTLNRLLILFPLGWVFPYQRFRDTHIKHHTIRELTDPFDDPESWYYPKFSVRGMNRIVLIILNFNNTLLGRMLIGPAISVTKFMIEEISRIIHDDQKRGYLIRVWGEHFLLCSAMVFIVVEFSATPIWMYGLAAYISISILLIRTFLEHQASEPHEERTVIIEKCCPLAFLFLYNNLHAVHHESPSIPWYQLPEHFAANREQYLNLNNHYVYASYGEIFRKYFLTPKENIAHPFLRTGMEGSR